MCGIFRTMRTFLETCLEMAVVSLVELVMRPDVDLRGY